MNLSSFLGAGWVHGPQVLCDEEGILLCRACRESIDGQRKIVLAVLPATEHPSPQSLDRLAHEFGLMDELDGAWAAKPLELLQDRARTILVLEDFGGEPLTWLMGAPMEMGASYASPFRSPARWARSISPASCTRTSSQPTSWSIAPMGGAAHRLRLCIATAARTTVSGAARVDRRHARLYGARTDRAHEPLDRFPQRPVLVRCHALPNAHRRTSLHRNRSDGVGALPYRQEAGVASRPSGECPGRGVRDRS